MKAVLIALAALVFATPALAYSPVVGARAADITGRDVVSNKVVHLSDYSGKWVMVDFWASWCGPCMGELPNMIAVTRPLRAKNKNFKVFTVSLDMKETSADLDKVIKTNKIDYPVVYDGNGWKSVQPQEWGINSIPATFLIDPAGNIVATGLRGENLAPGLQFFLNHKGPYAPVYTDVNATINADGSTTLKVALSNPRHTPLHVRLDYGHTKITWAADDPEHKKSPEKYEFVEPDPVKPEEDFTVDMDEFGQGVKELTIPAVEGASSVSYYVYVELPETESLLKGDGIWVETGGHKKIEAPKPEEAAGPVAPPAEEAKPADNVPTAAPEAPAEPAKDPDQPKPAAGVGS